MDITALLHTGLSIKAHVIVIGVRRYDHETTKDENLLKPRIYLSFVAICEYHETRKDENLLKPRR